MPPSKKMPFKLCSSEKLDAMLAARHPEQNTKDVLSKTKKELEKVAKECAADLKKMETKRENRFEIDLSDVPEMSPIKKSGRAKEGGSIYLGVRPSNPSIKTKQPKKNPWQARIKINGKDRLIGAYTSEKEAGAAYVRAVYKYGSERQKKSAGLPCAGDESNAAKSGKKKDGKRKEAVTQHTNATKGKGGDAAARKKKSVESTAANKGVNVTAKKGNGGNAAAKRKKSVKQRDGKAAKRRKTMA